MGGIQLSQAVLVKQSLFEVNDHNLLRHAMVRLVATCSGPKSNHMTTSTMAHVF